MRTTDILRHVLDLLDAVEAHKEKEHDHDEHESESRFKQILSMIDADSCGPLANSPNEVVAPIEAVTTDAGGGVNGPKHLADIRVKDPRI
jgi:hypothetical protein